MEKDLPKERKDSFFLMDKLIRDKYQPCLAHEHTLMLTLDQIGTKVRESFPNEYISLDEIRDYLEAHKFSVFNSEMTQYWLFKEK